MKAVDISAILVGYNFVVGILIMLSSSQMAELAGNVSKRQRTAIVSVAHTLAFTFGACVAVLSAAIYVVFHLLRIGL